MWSTFDCERTVLVVARTLTSTYRLLDAVELFRDDFRVEVVFAVNDTSAFSRGAEAVLRDAGVRLVSWESVRDQSFPYDLVLSASENVDFRDLAAHTVVLPHGLGFNKFVPDGEGGARLAGLPPGWVLREGRATVVLSHPEQREQLRAACPDSAGQTVLVGDPTLARLRASRALRARYREALGTGERTLVVLASTWGPDSLLGRWRRLPARLLAELPADQYQVCVVLHPNVWAFYEPAQLSLWLASALDAGLVLMPAEAGWQAALVAADLVLTDHGSLGLFAAALDRPLLHAGPAAEIVSGTPPEALLHAAPVMDPEKPLREQLDTARTKHQPGRYDHIAARVSADVGDAEANLRNLVYTRLGLEPPSAAPPLPRYALPAPLTQQVTSHVVRNVEVAEGVLTVTRFPAAVDRDTPGGATHLVADELERNLKLVERAAVIVRDTPLNQPEAGNWARGALTDYPGCRVVITATPHGGFAAVRNGPFVHIDLPAQRAVVPWAGSAIYCCWLSGALRSGDLTIRAGATTVPITLTVTPPPAGATAR